MVVSASKYPRLWTPTGTMVAILKDAYNVIVTDELINGDTGGQEVLDFNLPNKSPNRALIKNEMVITVGGSKFVVRTPWDGWDTGNPTPVSSVHCEALWYDLAEKDPVLVEVAVTDAHTAMTQVLNGTGWTVGTVEPTAGSLQVLTPSSPLALLRLIPQTFGGDLQFDNVNKVVHLLNHRGSSTTVALYAHGRNLQGNARQTDTTNLVTRLYPYGSTSGTVNGQGTNGVPLDISSVNGGVPYLEDYSFYDTNGWPHQVRAAVVTADNIMDPDTLKTWGQSQLTQLSKPAYTYTIQQSNTGVNDADPQLGDVVRVKDSDLGIDVQARVQARIRNILKPELTTYTIDTALTTLSQVIATSGGGGGTTLVGDTGTDTLAPAAPATVALVTQAVGGPSTAVEVTASWTQVVANEDGTPIVDLAGYQVQWNVNGGPRATQVVPPGFTAALLGDYAMGVTVGVWVRAYDTNGNYSAWTAPVYQNAVADDVPPPVPSAPTIDDTTLPGIVRVHWDGLDVDGNPMPPDFLYVRVCVSAFSGFVPDDTTTIDTLAAAGTTPILAGLGTWFVKLVARDVSGNESDASAQNTGTARQIVNTDIVDGAVTNAKIATDAIDARALADAAVQTAHLVDDAINAAKLAANAVDAAAIQAAAVGSAALQDASIVTAKIANLAVGTAQIADAAISNAKIGALAVGTANIADAAITNAKIGALAVNTAQIVDAAISTAKIADASIITAKIGNLAVGNAQIANLAVNDAKIGNVSVGKLIAGILAADITVSARIKTADTGARVEMSGTGIFAYNSGGVQTLSILSSNGSVTVTNGVITGGIVQTSAGLVSGGSTPGVIINGAQHRIEIYSGLGAETGSSWIYSGYYNVDPNRSGGPFRLGQPALVITSPTDSTGAQTAAALTPFGGLYCTDFRVAGTTGPAGTLRTLGRGGVGRSADHAAATTTCTTTETKYADIGDVLVNLEAGRRYEVTATVWAWSSVDGDIFTIRVRNGTIVALGSTPSSPANNSTLLFEANYAQNVAATQMPYTFVFDWVAPSDGVTNIAIFAVRNSGTGTISIGSAVTKRYSSIRVRDVDDS